MPTQHQLASHTAAEAAAPNVPPQSSEVVAAVAREYTTVSGLGNACSAFPDATAAEAACAAAFQEESAAHPLKASSSVAAGGYFSS